MKLCKEMHSGASLVLGVFSSVVLFLFSVWSMRNRSFNLVDVSKHPETLWGVFQACPSNVGQTRACFVTEWPVAVFIWYTSTSYSSDFGVLAQCWMTVSLWGLRLIQPDSLSSVKSSLEKVRVPLAHASQRYWILTRPPSSQGVTGRTRAEILPESQTLKHILGRLRDCVSHKRSLYEGEVIVELFSYTPHFHMQTTVS